MRNFHIRLVYFLFIMMSQSNADEMYKDEVCANQYLLKQYDVAFAACTASANEKSSYINLLNLGNMYLNGLGADKNTALAMKYFEKAIAYEGGDGTAEHNLAYAYSEGIGVEKNQGKAIELYRRAALSGHEGSQFNLAISYFNGEGVQVSYVNGYAWLLIASKSGSSEASELISQVSSQLSKQDKSRGEQKANQLLKSLPKSRIERMHKIKQDLINTINSGR